MFADLLITRTRTILWIALLAGLTFTAFDVGLAPHLAAPFFVKCIGVSLTTAALVFLRRPWAAQHALLVSVVVILAAYLLTAISGIVSPSREYSTTGVLFVSAALTTATLLPWGLWPQIGSVLFGAGLLAEAVFRADGDLHVLLDDPGVAVVIGLVLSLVTAREMQRYRLAEMRELAARRRAELEVRALNANLERRVAARTGELRAANEQLHALSARLELVREEERTRIAREIHDELGQTLTALKIDLHLLPKRLAETTDGTGAQVLRQGLIAASDLADTMINSVRRISAELRPSLLDDLGLTAAIAWQAREFESRCGVRCTFTHEPPEIALDPLRSTALFRIVQEALTNVARHANATSVSISLQEDRDHLRLEVHDDGRGATEAEVQSPQSFGLLGIRERARLLDGDVEIEGEPGSGTTVRVHLPPCPVSSPLAPDTVASPPCGTEPPNRQ